MEQSMASSGDVRLKQRAVIEFLTAEGCAPSNIHRRMTAVYGDACVDVSTVRRWARTVKDQNPAASNLHDQHRSGRPATASDDDHQHQVDELIRGNRRIKQHEIATTLAISIGSVNHIIKDLLRYKMCARWVPRQLTPDMKESRKRICQ